MTFSILIPSWNNLDYLKLCIRSLQENSYFQHELIVIINEGKDGSTEWIKKQESIKSICFKENVGICIGLNKASELATTEYILYINDDMYVLPNWDKHLADEIEKIGHDNFMLSGTMIEPFDTGNKCVIVNNFGENIENFEEEHLLTQHQNLKKENWNGSTWPPNIMPLSLWKKVGGMSEEFSPGMYSDPDLSMKCWHAGVRYFKGIGASKVYHFGSRSTQRLGKNVGRNLFKKKWGISSNTFTTKYLRRGENWHEALAEPKLNFIDKLKRKLS